MKSGLATDIDPRTGEFTYKGETIWLSGPAHRFACILWLANGHAIHADALAALIWVAGSKKHKRAWENLTSLWRETGGAEGPFKCIPARDAGSFAIKLED